MQFWSKCLLKLQEQLTTASFETWLRDTSASLENDRLTIILPNSFAKDWLESRHAALIARVAQEQAGRPLIITFTVKNKCKDNQPIPGDILISLLDPPNIPFLQVPFYALWFWQPLMGHLAFATYQMLRTRDDCRETGWGRTNRINVETIALTLYCHRQAITGCRRRSNNGAFWKEGAFNILNKLTVASITPVGRGKNVVYDAQVLNSLPLLTPQQVSQLPTLLQTRHRIYLNRHSINTKQWEQLELQSLIQPFACAPAQGACATAYQQFS